MAAPSAADGPSTSYRVLPVRLKTPGGPAVTRYLYIKPHSSPADQLPKERAVFVAGVPAALQGTALVDLFGRFGEIERAALHGSRVSAVLLFAAAEGRDKLMRAAAKARPVEMAAPEPEGPHGLKGGWAACLGGRGAQATACLAAAGSGSPRQTELNHPQPTHPCAALPHPTSALPPLQPGWRSTRR